MPDPSDDGVPALLEVLTWDVVKRRWYECLLDPLDFGLAHEEEHEVTNLNGQDQGTRLLWRIHQRGVSFRPLVMPATMQIVKREVIRQGRTILRLDESELEQSLPVGLRPRPIFVLPHEYADDTSNPMFPNDTGE